MTAFEEKNEQAFRQALQQADLAAVEVTKNLKELLYRSNTNETNTAYSIRKALATLRLMSTINNNKLIILSNKTIPTADYYWADFTFNNPAKKLLLQKRDGANLAFFYKKVNKDFPLPPTKTENPSPPWLYSKKAAARSS